MRNIGQYHCPWQTCPIFNTVPRSFHRKYLLECLFWEIPYCDQKESRVIKDRKKKKQIKLSVGLLLPQTLKWVQIRYVDKTPQDLFLIDSKYTRE